jgi:hypothetical protein
MASDVELERLRYWIANLGRSAPLAKYVSGTVQFLHRDALGSTQANAILTRVSKDVLAVYSCDFTDTKHLLELVSYCHNKAGQEYGAEERTRL